MGFGEEVFQLTMLNNKKKLEIISYLDPMPGHRSKFEDLF